MSSAMTSSLGGERTPARIGRPTPDGDRTRTAARRRGSGRAVVGRDWLISPVQQLARHRVERLLLVEPGDDVLLLGRRSGGGLGELADTAREVVAECIRLDLEDGPV